MIELFREKPNHITGGAHAISRMGRISDRQDEP